MRIIKISKNNFEEAVKGLVHSIKKGWIIVCPTDTVYGLICDATNKKAVEKIFKIKKREKNKPLLLFIKDIKSAKKLAFIDKKQEKLLKNKWPGKTTFILKRKMGLPKIIFGKEKTIGLRIPKYFLINTLLNNINKPLAQTSANISDKPTPTKTKEVIKQFRGEKYQPDLVIDIGSLPKRKPSTIIDLTKDKTIILRR